MIWSSHDCQHFKIKKQVQFANSWYTIRCLSKFKIKNFIPLILGLNITLSKFIPPNVFIEWIYKSLMIIPNFISGAE